MVAKELDNRTALVTGGNRGIGLASGRALAAAGARVVLTGRDERAGAAAVSAILSEGGMARFVPQDTSKEADWHRIIDDVLGREGRIDIVVANAGITHAAPIAEMRLEDFRSLNEINLKGVFFAVKHGAMAMRRHGEGGSLILIASIMGRISAPGYCHYSAAKAGVRLLAKAAALELGPENIRVNAILPGIIRTQMTSNFRESELAPLVPMRRFGEAEEIANAVLFAASGRSTFMTGTEMVVDGGWTAR